MIRISEIGVKKTVNTTDGRILGQISDFEIDPNEGKIRSIVLPVPGKAAFSGGENTSVFPGMK